MKGVPVKKTLVRLGSGCLAIIVSLVPMATASAHTFPYLKVYGADAAAGGWFSNGGGCVDSNYQDPTVQSTKASPNLVGGILTFAMTSGTTPVGGAASQYGAFALGDIDTDSTHTTSDGYGAPTGFYSSGAQAPATSRNELSFANITNIAGQFDGGSPAAAQCIPDYFGTKLGDSPAAYGGSIDSLSGTKNTYIDTSSATLNIAGGTVGAGKNSALFVKGNVYISGNITYGAHNASNVPKFALVVQGNIYIAPGVNQLDGLYIAQPPSSGTPTSKDGVIWTCHDSTASDPNSDYELANCTKPLVVNGALIAKHVNFFRIGGGTFARTTTAEDGAGSLATIQACQSLDPACNTAEIINYTPEMVMGGGFFNAGTSGGGGSTTTPPAVESLVSLPPVF